MNNIFQTTKSDPLGGRDGYLVRLNAVSGELIYGSFFGGGNFTDGSVGHDGIRDVAVNSQNELFIVGTTSSDGTNDFPFLDQAGAYFQQDLTQEGGFIAQFSSDLDLEWCTKYGGDSDFEKIEAVTISNDDKVAIAGQTESATSFIPVFGNTAQNLTPSGGVDWYLSVFNEDGSLTWGTFEGSTGSDDRLGAALAFDEDDFLFFAANMFSTSGINFIDPGGQSYFNNTNSGPSNTTGSFNNYAVLTRYKAEAYDPLWRTLLMDGLTLNKVSSIDSKEGEIFLSGSTADNSMPLQSLSSDMYSEPKTIGTGLNMEGYLMIFNGANQELIHSSYFGGDQEENQEAFVMNDEFEIFGFGDSQSRYYPDFPTYVGIPLKDNEVPGSWYRNGTTYDNGPSGYVFKMCAENTPLSTHESTGADPVPFEIVPNPVKNGNHIAIKLNSRRIEKMRISDLTGRPVMSMSGISLYNGISRTIQLPQLASGIYMVTIENDGRTDSRKMLIAE